MGNSETKNTTKRKENQSIKGVLRSKMAGGAVVLNWDEWDTMKVPPREMLLDPIIPQKGLIEIYSPRGIRTVAGS